MLNKIYVSTAIVIIILLTSFSIPANAAYTNSIKILSFNKGPWYYTDTTRPTVLANYVKQNNVEIVGLQEGRYANENQSEGAILNRVLKNIGYPMHILQVKETKHEANIIMSKYPFLENSYREHLIGGERNRIVQRVAVSTPYGNLWVINIHTNAARRCAESIEILKTVLTKPDFAPPPNDNVVIVGDFNIWLANENEVVAGCEGGWGQAVDLNKEIIKFKTTCLESNKCTNLVGTEELHYIDWIISPKTSNLYIKYISPIPEIKYIGDGHPALVSELVSSTFTVDPKTIYDFDKNGVVNLNDVIGLIKYLFTALDSNKQYDYNTDGVFNLIDVIIVIEYILFK